MTKIIYKTKASAFGAKDGNVTLSDNPTNFKLEAPVELGGAGVDKGLNSEHLLAGGYSACISAVIHFIISKYKLSTKLDKLDCEVILLRREDNGFKFDINLMAYFSNSNETDAKKILEEAHNTCPFSYSLRQNVNIKTEYKLT